MAWSAEDVVFGGRESFGWDECLPTVAPCPDPLDPAAAPLRDHGDQWGRGTYLAVDEAARCRDPHLERAALALSALAPPLVRRRAHRARRVRAARASPTEPQPLLWSQHPVFRLEPGCRIELPGVTEVVRTSQSGIDLPARAGWPLAAPAGGAPDRPLPGAHRPGLVGQALRRGARARQRRGAGWGPPRDRLGPRLRAGAGHLALVRRLAARRATLRAGRPGAHHVGARRPGLGPGRWPGTRLLEAGARLAWWVRLRLS